MENDSDEELVYRVVQGKDQAYGMLVERYQRPVFNLMYRYCRSEQEAADLSQDVFLRAYERLSSFDSEGNFSPGFIPLRLTGQKTGIGVI
jgi:RNA polymerase sigma-70 factor (ECF subfamily)